MMRDQQQSEAERNTARYARRLIEACLDPMMMISPEGKITDVNQATEQATGRVRAELIGSDFSDHFTEPDQAHAGCLEAFAKGSLRNYPLTLRHTSGRLTEVLYNASLYRSDQGEVAGVLAVARDISERKQAQNQINELNRSLERQAAQCSARLEAVNKELEAFTYSVSHDLRAPLRAIDGFSRILQEDYSSILDDEGKRLLGVVRDNAAWMAQLIDDILKFSRSGRLEIVPTEIDMAELARSAFDELSPSVDPARLQLEIGALPAVQGDRNMLRQVFINLLSNAIKFSRMREPAQIRVDGAIEGNEAVYSVQDNGVGFDMQYAGKLFGVFQRLHGVSEFEGTGIGLAIVKHIVARHGGRVWAEGEPGKGATFHFSIPLSFSTDSQGEPT